MSDSKNGGAAFPVLTVFQGSDGKQAFKNASGMSLRDYFAAKAMMGMAARDNFDAGQATPEQRAKLAYIEADAMLAERAKVQP